MKKEVIFWILGFSLIAIVSILWLWISINALQFYCQQENENILLPTIESTSLVMYFLALAFAIFSIVFIRRKAKFYFETALTGVIFLGEAILRLEVIFIRPDIIGGITADEWIRFAVCLIGLVFSVWQIVGFSKKKWKIPTFVGLALFGLWAILASIGQMVDIGEGWQYDWKINLPRAMTFLPVAIGSVLLFTPFKNRSFIEEDHPNQKPVKAISANRTTAEVPQQSNKLPSNQPNKEVEIRDSLETVEKLYQQGLITKEERDQKRKDILNKI